MTAEIIPSITVPEPTDAPSSPFLLVEGNLGVPERLLYKLYLKSIKEFATLRDFLRNPSSVDATVGQRLLVCTAVIILANPAHDTALNARKRLILSHHWSLDKEWNPIPLPFDVAQRLCLALANVMHCWQ